MTDLELEKAEMFESDNSTLIGNGPILFMNDVDTVSCNLLENFSNFSESTLNENSQKTIEERILEVAEISTPVLLDLSNANIEFSSVSIIQPNNKVVNDYTITEYPISDDSDTNNIGLVPYPLHSDSDSSFNEPETNKTKRRKRCQVDKSTWADSLNAINREKGKRYFGRKMQNGKWNNKVPKNERIMKCQCNCSVSKCNKSVIKCIEISDEDRKKIFNAFWLLSWGEKKVYIDSLVKMIPTVRPRDRKNSAISKRSHSMLYHLKVNDKLIRVCKTMFLNTLDIGKTAIWNWKNDTKENFTTAREKNQSTTKTASIKKIRKNAFQNQVDCLIQFFDTLPKMESHYCRKETSKKYLLPEWASKKALYDWYVSDWCSLHNVTAVSIAKFNNTLETLNISLFHPKKDQCEKCAAHKLGFISDDEHMLHVTRKEEARAEKEKDKNSENVVFAVDVQALLSAPKSNVSSLYYKSRLNVHNFCAFNLKTKDGYCFLWNEVEGGVSAEEFSSLVVHLILHKILPQNIKASTDSKIIIYSDGCAAQNRNVTISNALLNLAMINNVTIEQKYLEVGHTQMEVDSMHAAIERKLRNKIVNVPAEYISICRSARKNPGPYNVEYITYSFFKSFSSVKFLKSIRPGRMKGDPKVNDIRALQYLPNGNIYFKLKFADEWQLLPQRRELVEPQEFHNLPNLHSCRLPLTNRKFQDLQDLKTTIPSDYHSYYDNLPHL